MTMITPSYLGETIEYSSLHACRSTLEDPTAALRGRGSSAWRSRPVPRSLAAPSPAGLRPLAIRPPNIGDYESVCRVANAREEDSAVTWRSPGRSAVLAASPAGRAARSLSACWRADTKPLQDNGFPLGSGWPADCTKGDQEWQPEPRVQGHLGLLRSRGGSCPVPCQKQTRCVTPHRRRAHAAIRHQ